MSSEPRHVKISYLRGMNFVDDYVVRQPHSDQLDYILICQSFTQLPGTASQREQQQEHPALRFEKAHLEDTSACKAECAGEGN
jgi:hypothetical protein